MLEKEGITESEIQKRTSFYEMPSIRLAAVIFIVSLSVRILLDLVFFLRYGWHASYVSEIWFYYGVANDAFKLKLLDPTLWVLKVLGLILPKNLLYYGVVFAAGTISSITAVLIFFLGTELYSKKTGFIAGFLYGAMVQPVSLSIVSFTHDIVQMPFIVLSILLFVRAVRVSDTKKKAANFLLFAVLLYLGWQINQVITVALDAAVLFLGLELVYMLGDKYKTERERAFFYYFVVITIGVLVARLTLLPEIFNEVFGEMAQGRTGSLDIVPVSLGSLWIRYNFLWLLIPLGLIYAFRTKDIVGYSIFLIGLVISTLVDRGTRILDIGVSIIVAHTFIEQKANDEKVLAGGLLLVILSAIFFLNFSPLLNIFFAISSFSLFYLLKNDKQITAGFPYIFSALMIVSGVITFNVTVSPSIVKRSSTTDSEYHALEYLKGISKAGEKIHVNWAYGYFAQAVSGVKAASSPRYVNEDLFKTSWQAEKTAAEKFREEEIAYVMVTTRDFEILSADPERDSVSFRTNRGILFKPASNKLSRLKDTLMYKMLYDEASLSSFEKIYEEKDRTGLIVKIYRVL